MCTYFALLMKCAIVVNACDSLVNGASAQPDLLRYVLSNTGCLHVEGMVDERDHRSASASALTIGKFSLSSSFRPRYNMP